MVFGTNDRGPHTNVRRLMAETGCLVGSHGVVIAVAGSAIKTVTRDAKPPRKTKFRARNPNGHPPLVRFAVQLVSSAHQTHKRRPESTRPQASSVQVWHFPGQKLRLGGDALGADPTYLLYLPFRSHGGI